jgi:hypothetical protein
MVTLLRAYPAARALGSSRDLVGSLAGVAYTARLEDGLVRAIVASRVEAAAEQKHDAIVDAVLRVATPRLGFGRLILDGVVAHRYQNYLNRRFALGGDGRLRGYRSAEAIGTNFVAANAEFRSAGVNVLSAECGFAAFYDVGDARDSLSEVRPLHSAGLGLRLLIPQANRIVFRADFAVPLNEPSGVGFYATFGQAFFFPELSAPAVSTDD